ncbi:MAG: RluA family pseudouridine synthase [Prevotella sp.]|nr:RluA family pseudouridine synthase [Prevotella sp.]
MKNMRTVDIAAGVSDEGKTCGSLLRSRGVSRRLTARLKRVPGGITRGGRLIRTVDTVHAGDVISLKIEDERLTEPNGGLFAPVIYEDGDIIVFDKPAGMPVHPSAGHREDTLGNFFASLYPDLTFRPINRLDRYTSGLCAAAKNAYAASLLNGKIFKVYYAVTEGTPVPEAVGNPLVNWYSASLGEFVIDAPIGREEASVVRRTVRADGKRAVTRYTILKENGGHCLVRVILETGRTHQIRVHFSSVGHPLAGDGLYGGSALSGGQALSQGQILSEGQMLSEGQILHCGEMRFARPADGKIIEISCPLRKEMLMFRTSDEAYGGNDIF